MKDEEGATTEVDRYEVESEKRKRDGKEERKEDEEQEKGRRGETLTPPRIRRTMSASVVEICSSFPLYGFPNLPTMLRRNAFPTTISRPSFVRYVCTPSYGSSLIRPRNFPRDERSSRVRWGLVSRADEQKSWTPDYFDEKWRKALLLWYDECFFNQYRNFLSVR